MRNDATHRPSPEQEQALIEGLLRQDDAAWRRFHAQYDRLIYRCIRKVSRSFPSLLRRDDEHEIFSNLLVSLLAHDRRKLRSFDPNRGSRLSTWLGLLATHAAYDYLRALRREVPRVPLEHAEHSRWLGASPFDQVERRQQRRLVDELLGRLSAKDQQFVSLYFGRGLAPERIADAMRISVKTVYSKKHKIQSRLESFAATRQLAA